MILPPPRAPPTSRPARRRLRRPARPLPCQQPLRLTKDKSFVPLPPNLIFMNRLQFGFYSVLARLDAEVDYAAVEHAFLHDAPTSNNSVEVPAT